MEPENDTGNVEYKLYLKNDDEEKIQKLATQMRFRCEESDSSECFYNIGVSDNGDIIGVTEEEYNQTINILNKVADKNNYSVTLLTSTPVDKNKNIYEVLIREKIQDKYIDIKVCVAGSVDAGKCLDPYTKVVMYDGQYRFIKDVVVGDVLMGDDSTPRKVLKLYKGETKMYTVNQEYGMIYKVTGNHILTLKSKPTVEGFGNFYKVVYHIGNGVLRTRIVNDYEEVEKCMRDNVETLDIAVCDYFKKHREWKTYFYGYSACINFKNRKTTIDPYVYGLNIKSSISYEYKYNSIENRLKLLAGIIDSQNNIFKNRKECIELYNCNFRLIKDIKYLCNSLGFKISITEISVRIYNHVNLNQIPVKKRNINLEEEYDSSISMIEIDEEPDYGRFNGFELDKNGRFLLEDFTVTHNSSIIGSLVTGEKDDGRGLTRSSVFNYIHELKTGRTSSIAHHILGFDYNGNVVNNQSLTKLSWMDIVNKSSKIISLFDLAGHEKYLKTTILGISSSFPDLCIIMISANNGISVMTKEHIVLCITLKVPFIIVISKIDICKDRKNILDETVSNVNKILKHPVVRRIPLNVRTTEDILLSVKNIYNFNMTPIFYTSCVTGEGMDKLKQFLNLVGKNNSNIIKKNNENKVEYHIDHIYNVLGVGIVLGGNLVNGSIKIGDKLLMGPGTNGEYENVMIKSIYCKKISLQVVSHGSYVCLGIKKIDKKLIKRGNVIISNNNDRLSVKKFISKITVLRTHSTSIRVGYEPLFHAYSIRKVVKIIEIANKKNAKNCVVDDNILRSNDTADVTFEFKHDPQYLKVGTRFIISEGKCKICGEVLELI